MDQDQAREALEAMQGAKDRLADVYAEFPAWRHAVVGLACGALVLAVSAPDDLFALLLLPCVLLAFWVIRNERANYGMSVRGIKGSGNVPFAIFVSMVLYGMVMFARSTRGEPFPSPQALGIAAAAAVFGIAISVIRRRMYRAMLRRDDQA